MAHKEEEAFVLVSIDGLMLLSLVWMGYLYEANSNLHLFFLQALYERGQKLSELEEKTAQMMANAENFQQAANQIMQKYKDKKWYQFWVETEAGVGFHSPLSLSPTSWRIFIVTVGARLT